MYATLGNIRFEGLKGFTALSKSRATKYSEVPRIGGKPALQRVGEELESISFSIRLHADFSRPEKDLQELDDARTRGASLTLILGNGNVLGDYLIVSISDNTRKTADDGSVIYLEAEVELKEADTSNRLLLQEVQATQEAFANSTQKIIPTAEVPLKPTVGNDAGKLSQDINVQAISAGSLIEQAGNNATAQNLLLKQASHSADLASLAALEIANKVRLIQSKVSNAEQIISNAEGLAVFADDLKNAADSGNLAESVSTNAIFQQANTAFQASASTLVSLIALRQI